MYWLIEEKEQLEKLSYNKQCFISIIPLNHNYHPKLTEISLIYYKVEGHKGYIFPINHNDGIGIELGLVKEFILKHPNIYILDKKKSIYFLGEEFLDSKIIDINLLHLESNINNLEIPDYKSIVANYIEGSFKTNPNLNSYIPVTKHYEEQDLIYNFIKKYIGNQFKSTYYNTDYIEVMYRVENEGMSLDNNCFEQHYSIKHPQLSIKDNKIFTQYNLYNFTSRPSNSFNGVNFGALKKNDGTREFIIPSEDYLFEFDMNSYHLFLSAKIIGFDLPQGDIHTEFGKSYFGKEELSEEEYKESKQLSFKQMNGGVFSQYKHVPFWNKLENHIKELWKRIQEQGFVELVGGRQIKLSEIPNPTPQKCWNYIIQSSETYYNILILKDLFVYLRDKKSKIILYSYDAILLDYKKEDGKHLLKDIKKIIEKSEFRCSVSYGINYNSLRKIKASE